MLPPLEGQHEKLLGDSLIGHQVGERAKEDCLPYRVCINFKFLPRRIGNNDRCIRDSVFCQPLNRTEMNQTPCRLD